jgi:hypothetical protein
MSTFGKYGVGGSVPGKFPTPSDETPFDFAAAATGTERGNPDSKPEVQPTEGSHIATK